MSRYVHHNKCKGGYAIDEVDGKTYCYGRIQKGYDDIVYVDECVRCPRFVNTFADKMEKERWLQDDKMEGRRGWLK